MEVSIAVVQRVAAVVISQRITVLSDVRRSGESLRGRCPQECEGLFRRRLVESSPRDTR